MLDTILKDRDIHDETILLAEREFQLGEYNYLKNKIRDRENKEIEELKNHFADQFRDSEWGYAIREFPQSIIRQCLKTISYIDILEFIDTAVDITSRDSKGDYHTVAAAKYLTAILRNKLRENKKSSTTTDST